MQGETDLSLLLEGMNPELKDEVFVFHTTNKKLSEISDLDPVGFFKEREGLTLIFSKEIADRNNLGYEYPCKMITLNVNSSLEAVGFLAAITQKFAESGISVNAISAFHHDHLFVPVDKVDQAMNVLKSLTRVKLAPASQKLSLN